MSKKPPTLKCEAVESDGIWAEPSTEKGKLVIVTSVGNGIGSVRQRTQCTPTALRKFTEAACKMVEKGKKE